jgi:hypothetical protein
MLVVDKSPNQIEFSKTVFIENQMTDVRANGLTAFKLLPDIPGRKNGSFFTGVYLPQKLDLAPPLERERNSV